MLKPTQTLAAGESSLETPTGGSPRLCGMQVDRVVQSVGQIDEAREPSPAAAAGGQTPELVRGLDGRHDAVEG